MTKKENDRYTAIINELSNLSRNGWRDAKPYDYLPLEAELRILRKKKYGV